MLSAHPLPQPQRVAAWAAAAVLAFTFALPPAYARSGPDSFAPLAKQVSPAVVNIAVVRDVQATAETPPSPFPPGSPWDQFMRRYMPRENGPARRVTGQGSGFVIDPSGYVVTNNHVVGEASDIAVTFSDGKQLKARLVGRDDKTDLALIKVESDTPLPAVRWGDSDRIEVGDWVLAVGNPFGLGGTVTAGIVSARGRDIQSGPFDDFLQLDAPINQGNSGGPSFNMAGEVIGVNTAIYSPNGGSVGIGFAIPAGIAKPVIEALRRDGRIERGWIGVSVQPLTPEIAFGLGLPTDQEGALVAQLDPSGPAAKAGLRQGDVIVAVDGTKVTRLRDLPRLIAGMKPGTKAMVEIRRRGASMTLPLAIGATPSASRAEATPVPPAPRAVEPVGLALAPLTPELRQQLRLAPTAHGVIVADVKDGSEAELAGIAVGDVIVEIGGGAVSLPAEVERAFGAARAERRDSIVLLVARHGMEQFVAVKLPRVSS
ncbi:MAG: DegQ family serine endoprotease [Alphaproteobacteria bacterium]|nr:DegQ family serine endoprotease [Alphaproteobacteria bacterium]